MIDLGLKGYKVDEPTIYILGPLLWKKVQDKEEGKKDNKDCENNLPFLYNWGYWSS